MDRRLAASVLVSGVVLLAAFGVVLTGDEPPAAGDTGAQSATVSNGTERFSAADVSTHRAALANASYEFTYVENRSDGQVLVSSGATAQADRRGRVTAQAGTQTVTQYVENGTLYVRVESPNGTEYDRTPLAELGTDYERYSREVAGIGELTYFTDQATFTPTGQVRRDGTVLTRYEVSTVSAAENPDAALDHYSGEVLVDSDGIVRTATLQVNGTVDGEPQRLSVEYHVTALGTATVERPDWVGQARENETAG